MFGLIPNKVEMAEEKEIKEWQKYRRQSIQALPWTVAFSLVLALVFFLVNLVVPIPFWLIVLVFGIQGFVIVGDVESELQNALISLAKSLGIPSSLSFAGRVSLEDFKSYAQAADACVQLRHPTRGETSAALLRALAAGAACVVSADGPMGELPDTVVLKVRSRHESTDLVAALARLMGDSGLRGQLGHAALSHVQTHHSFRQAADGYAAMIELTAHRRQARNALWLEGACDALAVSRDPQITKLILPWARLRLRGQTALRASSRASPP